MNNTKTNYFWDEDTINHFKFVSSYLNSSQLKQEIKKFVECNCQLEEGENENDLVEDLIELIIKL